ncbi:MAG: protein translocase subunit SecD [Candidatus Cloacimonetes bacterium]|nr:protein translocase subunit SecD [Candidatus Cloacimonadota bacterium]
MRRSTIRTISIVLFVIITLFYLSPLFLAKEYDEYGDISGIKKPIKFWTSKMLKLGLDLRGGMEINLYVDLSELPRNDHDSAVKAAVEVIQNRIDQFGVAEPMIQRVGDNKIVVQLPGLRDFQRAKDLIGKTALLEFKLVATPEQTSTVINQVDSWLAQNYQKFPYLNVLDYTSGQPENAFEDSLGIDQTAWYNDILSYLTNAQSGRMSVSYEYKQDLRRLLNDPLFEGAVPPGYQLLLEKENSMAPREDVPVYLLIANAELTGTYLTNAETRFGGKGDFGGQNKSYVNLRFNREGSRIFERITGQNIRRNLAIVLDDVVYMAPTIQDRIRGGEAQITGNFTLQECNDLVIVLKAGNLPAPVSIGEERIVGPSLGSDSINNGMKAGIIGLVLVMICLVLYYKLAGMIANLALCMNTAFVLAALTFFEATLTLPGIAGLILTLGFAVDANVLIFERIKEEMKSKTIKNAIETGYARALVTIVDSNLTSLIVAIVLYQFGSGSVRGFAVTLFIGLVASFFTAIVVTKAIFDKMVAGKNIEKLSI